MSIIAAIYAASVVLSAEFTVVHTSVLFVAGVLLCGLCFGERPAIAAAVAAFFLYDWYHVLPRYTIRLQTADDYNIILGFAAIAGLTVLLARRIRMASETSRALADQATTLFQASRRFAHEDNEDAVLAALAEYVGSAVNGEAVVVSGDRVWVFPVVAEPPKALLAEMRDGQRQTLLPGTTLRHRPDWTICGLGRSDKAFGAAAWRCAAKARTPVAPSEMITVLMDLAARAIEHGRLHNQRVEIEAKLRTDQLRDALLSSISHDFRTPLTAIMASVTSLRTYGDRFEPAVRLDLIATIHEEAGRLNRFVANLLSIMRIDSNSLVLEIDAVSMVEILDRLLERPFCRGRLLLRDYQGGRFLVAGDAVLLEQALGNVLENALRFAPPTSPVRVELREDSETVSVAVEDEGAGLDPSEYERVFQKFYRSPHQASAMEGTGLGLFIARGLIESMGGSIKARTRHDERSGLRIEARIPRSPVDA
jgi:two-component system sensor histidine kinase KdpD